jgi:hypothetical protein
MATIEELEVQNKALWGVGGECERALDCSLKCDMETAVDRKPALDAITAIQKAKEA